MPDINSINKDLDDLKEKINEFKNNIKEIISQLNFLMENLDNYYKLYSDIVNNFDNKKRNYTIIQNMNDMNTFNNNFKKNINKIINDKNLISKFNNIIEILDKMIIQKNNNDTSQENNINEKKKYDSSNDKYENFDLDKIKELKSLKIENLSYGFFVLHDGTILFRQYIYKKENENKTEYKFYAYNPNNDLKFEINYDIVKVDYSLQMDDDNIITIFNDEIKLSKIKEKKIEEIQTIKKDLDIGIIYKISNKKILIKYIVDKYSSQYNFEIYSYEKGKLIYDKRFSIYEFLDLCIINEKEIIIYYYEYGKYYGFNAFLVFYDITNDNILEYKEMKILKLGDYNDGDNICLINNNYVIVELDNKLLLVDIINFKINKSFKISYNINKIIRLNEKTFIIHEVKSSGNNKYYSLLHHYEIENNNKIKLIKEKNFPSEIIFIGKYPGNKLIIAYGNEIKIYS